MLKYYNYIFKNLKQISINNKHSFVHKLFTNTKIKSIQHLLVLFFLHFFPYLCVSNSKAHHKLSLPRWFPNSPKMNSEFKRIEVF